MNTKWTHWHCNGIMQACEILFLSFSLTDFRLCSVLVQMLVLVFTAVFMFGPKYERLGPKCAHCRRVYLSSIKSIHFRLNQLWAQEAGKASGENTRLGQDLGARPRIRWRDYISWLVWDAPGLPRRSWRMRPGRGKTGLPYWGFCPRDLDKRKITNEQIHQLHNRWQKTFSVINQLTVTFEIPSLHQWLSTALGDQQQHRPYSCSTAFSHTGLIDCGLVILATHWLHISLWSCEKIGLGWLGGQGVSLCSMTDHWARKWAVATRNVSTHI